MRAAAERLLESVMATNTAISASCMTYQIPLSRFIQTVPFSLDAVHLIVNVSRFPALTVGHDLMKVMSMSGVKAPSFTNFDIGSMRLKNRLAVAPMTRVSASEKGAPTEHMSSYYERFAKGGFGLIVTEGFYIDQQSSQGYLYQPGMSDADQANAWKPLVQRLQAYSTAVVAQIMHAGALSQGNRFTDVHVAPSAVKPKGEQMAFYFGKGTYQMPEAMSEEDIQQVIASFVSSAKLAINNAGFDGVEIHAANGYLLDQFLTDYTNQRDDRWGGSLSGRATLIVAVLEAVKAAVGDRVPVGVRISQGKVNDFTHKWADGEEAAKQIFTALKTAGADYIHVTEYEAWQPAFEGGTKSLVSLAHQYAPDVAIIANGNLHQGNHSAEMLGQGADVIAFGRAALANPDLPQKLAGGVDLEEFDSEILAPIANIKQQELALT